MNKRININLVILLVTVTTCMAQQTTIYTIGDSTMANKENAGENPEYGWGQVLRPFFKENVSVVNRAVNGRSSKSFITEGRWEAILEILKEGDFVFIQFGHNDQKTISPDRYTNPHVGYRHNLIKYVLETRGKGAKPILISSIVRRSFNEHGTLIDTHGDYPLESRLVALEYNVPFIDLQYLSEQLEESYGMEGSKNFIYILSLGKIHIIQMAESTTPICHY